MRKYLIVMKTLVEVKEVIPGINCLEASVFIPDNSGSLQRHLKELFERGSEFRLDDSLNHIQRYMIYDLNAYHKN